MTYLSTPSHTEGRSTVSLGVLNEHLLAEQNNKKEKHHSIDRLTYLILKSMFILRAIMESFDAWKSKRTQRFEKEKGKVQQPNRPPSEVGSIRSTLSVGALEDRLSQVEETLAKLASTQKDQTDLLNRQLAILETLAKKESK